MLEAPDGGGASRILRDRAIDVVTLDEQMPGLSGLDGLSRIKALDPSIAVALITGVHDAQTAVEASRLGARVRGQAIQRRDHRAVEKRGLA